MVILAINTAARACDLALMGAGTVLAETTEDMAKGQDARLPGAVSEILLQAGLEAGELDRIAVVCGPGSFTGVRIGVAFARGFALTLGIDCVGVTSLEAASPVERAAAHRVALIARQRPPDISFWTQDLSGAGASGPAEERPLDQVKGPLPIYSDRPDLLEGARPCAPAAVTAARRAETLTPRRHPARPVYVRAPDAALPARP